MDTFFKFLKKGLVATVFVMFATVATYIPIPHQNNIETAQADTVYCTNCSTFATDAINQAKNIAEFIKTNASLTYSAAVDALYRAKDWAGDGAAWALAKRMLSTMLRQITNWIQSGFNGRPMFVEDIQGYLKEVADQVFGEYIQELGGAGSFLCDPFKLDIQIALSQQFQRVQNEQEVTCTLSNVIDNIEGFMSGAQGSFSQGGWDDWFEITSAPNVYTPYGSSLKAEARLQAKIVGAQEAENSLVNQGNGFLSTKDCKNVTNGDVTKKICSVVTPGRVIEEQLNKNLGSGQNSLVEADEINEVFLALLDQVANKLFAGSHSLLKL